MQTLRTVFSILLIGMKVCSLPTVSNGKEQVLEHMSYDPLQAKVHGFIIVYVCKIHAERDSLTSVWILLLLKAYPKTRT